eukprot:195295-Chlamydomonas_euryale.AAC.2
MHRAGTGQQAGIPTAPIGAFLGWTLPPGWWAVPTRASGLSLPGPVGCPYQGRWAVPTRASGLCLPGPVDCPYQRRWAVPTNAGGQCLPGPGAPRAV